MKILMHTTYYVPHVSGLTIYFQQLAEEYARMGHSVVMSTSQFEANLPARETVNGVDVHRVKPWFRLNKGVFLPQVGFNMWRQIKNADVVHLNLPAIEGLFIAIVARFLGKKVVSTYVCDIYLPHIKFSQFLEKLIDISHWFTLKLSHVVASYTTDFAQNSRLLKNFDAVQVLPPVLLAPQITPVDKLKQITAKPIIGMATRIAAEKGVHVCLEAVQLLRKSRPNAVVVIAGTPVPIGEEAYSKRIHDLAAQHPDQLVILGNLTRSELMDFYNQIDVLVVASTNSTEAFGLVQIEAMLHNKPVVAVDLPGVRVPVQLTGMGAIAQIGSASDLANKIQQVLNNYDQHVTTNFDIAGQFSVSTSANNYLKHYE